MVRSIGEKSFRLDDLWMRAAGVLGFGVVRPERSSDESAYIHYDGRAIVVAPDHELEEDDSLAQLVFHELCHHLVEGPKSAGLPDWGLDNRLGSSVEIDRERACLRLQGHLAAEHGLQTFMCPTHPPSRAYYRQMGNRPLERPGCSDGGPRADWARQVRPVRRALAVLASADPLIRRTLTVAQNTLAATATLLYQ